jgi:hypothetical protein
LTCALLFRKQLWSLLKYYKKYNVFRASANWFHGYHQTRLRETEEYLVSRMKLIFNNSFPVRKESQNNLSHVFPSSVSGCVDTFPIFIRRPRGRWQSACYNGKYKGHVLKVSLHAQHNNKTTLYALLQIQIVVDHTGSPIWWSGPHLGTTADVEIWRANHPTLDVNEKLLADKAYQGDHDLLTPYKRKKHQVNLCCLRF